MPVKYPIKVVEVASDSGSESISIPFTRARELYTNDDEYTLTDKDTLQNPPHTYSSIANEVYGNEDLWYVLADANPLIHESDLQSGLKIKIPDISRRVAEDINIVTSSIT